MFAKILVPLDGSQNSYRGLQVAVNLAQKLCSSVTIMHVVELPFYAYSHPMGFEASTADGIKNLEEEGKKLLEKKKEELVEKGLAVRTLLVTGNPANEILKASEEYDLIVMGSRGLGTLKSLLLGSVSDKVLQQANKAVLIVRPE